MSVKSVQRSEANLYIFAAGLFNMFILHVKGKAADGTNLVPLSNRNSKFNFQWNNGRKKTKRENIYDGKVE